MISFLILNLATFWLGTASECWWRERHIEMPIRTRIWRSLSWLPYAVRQAFGGKQ